MCSYDSCQHVGAINKRDVEKSGESMVKGMASTESKKDSPFLIISAATLALEATTVPPQYNLQQDNDSSEAHSYLKQVFVVKCTSCDKSLALLIDGKYHDLCETLFDEEKEDGWIKVESEADRLVYFVLSQLIYRDYEVPIEDEMQVDYALPDDTDLAKVLWINGNAAGFYSVKPKGTVDLETMDYYRMTVLDTIFIRSSFRRRGFALTAIQDLLAQFPDENIGLSVPISLPMTKVLKKHLEFNPADRMKLWEVTGSGSEGNCQILWYIFKSRRS